MTLDSNLDQDAISRQNSGIRLSGDQFQSLILEKILKKHFPESKANFSIMDAHAGEVDFWIRISNAEILPFGLKSEFNIFVECKNYRRALDLDSVAKIFLVGVRRQPDILAVVARTELQKQAWDYAAFLFSIRGKGDCNPIFRNTQFDYYKTSDIMEVDFDNPLQPSPPSALTTSTISPLVPPKVMSWEVVEYRPYSEIRIADDSAPKDTVWLCNGGRYRVRLAIQVDDAMDWTIAGVRPLPNGVDAKAAFDKNGLDNFDRSILKVVIDLSAKANAAQGGLRSNLRLDGTRRRNVAVGLPFMLGMISDENFDPGDIRPEITEDLFRRIASGSIQPVILLGGPAGVGKTYLCEQLAINLRQKAQVDVNCFTLGTDTDHRLIWDMLLTASVPPNARKTSDGNSSSAPWEAIAAAVVARVNAVDQQEAGLDGPSGVPAQENVIPVLTGLLAAAAPRLIVFRDAHRLSEVAAQHLSTLICGLDDRSWGRLHIIFEHRTDDTNDSDDRSPWHILQSQLKEHLNKIDEIYLRPLTQDELGKFLEKSFESITPNLVARIWQLSGGLPLHLESLWNILLHEGAIEKISDTQFRVLRPSVFDNIEIKGGRGASIVQTRLAKVPWESVQFLPNSASIPIKHFASIIAHLHDAEKIRKFKALTEIDETDFEKFCRLLSNEGLIYPVPPDGSALRFRHDLLRQGLRRMVAPDRRSQDAARIILGKVDVTTATSGTLELYSDIADWAGFSWEAITALEAALAQLTNSVDFSQRKRLRRKLIQRIGPCIDENDPTAVQRLVAHRIALGWEEWNTGSIVEARTLFHAIAADCLERIKRGDGGGWPEQNAANALRRAVGLELELGDPVAMAKTARQALGLKTGWIEYNSILNRLVLYCARYSQVVLGKRFAKLALQSFSGIDPTEGARSVICSDIGSLFRVSAPDTALFFYRKALEVSKREDDFRQHTYSHMELALTEALLDVEIRRAIDIDRLRSDLHQAGLQDMLSRVDMVSGALAMLEGRIETGRMQTERALTSAQMYGRRHLLIAAENDALIGALAAGDKERSKELAVSLLKRLKHHIEIRRRSATIVADIEPLALQAATRLGDVLTPWELPMPAQPPLFSGTWVAALLNLKQIAAGYSQLGRTLAPARHLWPDDMDEEACRSALVASTINCRLEVKDLSLIFCAN